MTEPRPVPSLDVPRFCGVPSFMRLPQAAQFDRLDAAIIGLPSDSGSPFRTGARFGPNAIRAMSVMLRPVNPYRGGIDVFARLCVADAGDAPVVPGYLEDSLAAMTDAVAALVAAGVRPVALGGDHSVSLAALRAVARRHGKLALVHFDSHSDTWDRYFAGKRYSAGTPFRRAAEEGLIDPRQSIQVGLRGSLFRPDDITQSEALGFLVLSTDAMFAQGLAATARQIEARVAGAPCYLTFDMDFVDPAGAPGVQTPEAGGPSPRETLLLLRAIARLDLVGADVVETNPLYDGPGQVTALLAATIAAEILALMAVNRASESGGLI